MSSLNVGNCRQSPRIQVAYHGPARIADDLVLDCAVLEDGRRGYVMRGMLQAVGIKWNMPLPAFARFCGKISDNSLIFFNKTSSGFDVQMPNGATGIWIEEGIVTEIASGVVDAALDGRLRKNQMHMVPRARALMRALAKVGERGLIDEATGYQYHRAPDDLQSLVYRLIRADAAQWERCFPEEFYAAVCGLFGFKYAGRHRPLPAVIGQITLRHVYEAVFPPSIIAEIKSRKGHEKLHQWLNVEGGKPLLVDRIKRITALAQTSTDYRDFEARVALISPGRPVQLGLVFPVERMAA